MAVGNPGRRIWPSSGPTHAVEEQRDGGRDAREQDALGEQRTNDLPSIGSYRQSNGDLAQAIDRAREHEMRDVDRADQQQEQRDREDAGRSESGKGL